MKGIMHYSKRFSAVITFLLPILLTNCKLSAQTVPDFNRDIRPILAARCFACHGPDEQSREADLRLDNRKSAIELEAIVPGKPDESELFQRIQATDDSRMPPRDSGESLTNEEISILKAWIREGAIYQEHWAFVLPRKSPPPAVVDFPATLKSWSVNPIDQFVLQRLIQKGKQPAPPADRYTLVRRLYLDLIGLPPTPEQADAFVNNDDPDSYDQLVNQLMDSTAYGEKWGREWLDLARYADTNGYEKDRPRSIWPYRDWVIRAINRDMPFDQFTIEQLAGDMLDDATNSQRVATGFHRNTMLNEEGGIDPLEYRFYAMVDRVATTGTVWMGLTTGCAQCHTHKYDPITHTDYYRLMGLLNNADEPDLMVADPGIEQARKAIEEKIEAAESRLKKQLVERVQKDRNIRDRSAKQVLQAEVLKWIDSQKNNVSSWTILRPIRLQSNLPKLVALNDHSIFASGDFTKRDVYDLEFELDPSQTVASVRLEVLPDIRLPAGGPGNAYYEGRKGDFFLSEMRATMDGQPVEFDRASTTFGKISIGSGSAEGKNVFDNEGSTGWSTAGQEGRRNVLVLNLKREQRGERLKIKMIFERHFVASLGRFRLATSSHRQALANLLPDEVERSLASFKAGQPVADAIVHQFLLSTPMLKKEQQIIASLKKQLPQAPQTMVLKEREPDNPRTNYRYHRGEYLNPRETVRAQLPSLFRPFDEDIQPNRLNFARWLVSENNPLAARVTVNRYWQSFFGTGLVESAGDFGTQSVPPTHPLLLDWLAVSFREQGWSRKKIHRLIVTSSTYKQSSIVKADSYAEDPLNRWLSRGPRFRVHAETIRDIMLTASGKLSTRMFGPSVYPPQPATVTAIAYGNTKWPVSKGEDRYRRSLYTFSKRTAPFAAYLTFNSPTGENCVARRDRSNTPLQALTILNDSMFVELAQALAELVLKKNPGTERKKAEFVFRRLLTRFPTPTETDRILDFYHQQLSRLENNELPTDQITGKRGTPELAAWTLVARSLMNLDEVITKQ